MEIYVWNLPFDLKSPKLKRAIASHVRQSLGPRAEFDWHRFRNKSRGSGKLTFPTIEMGQQFLNAYRDGIILPTVNGCHTVIRISLSKCQPDAWLVKGLRKRMDERRRSQNQSEDEGLDENSLSQLQFNELRWGTWMSGGAFGCCGMIEVGGSITYNAETREISIVRFDETTESGMTIDPQTIHELFVDPNAYPFCLYFTLERIPEFWSEDRTLHVLSAHDQSRQPILEPFDYERPSYRLPALCSEHGDVAPYCTVYAFDLHDTAFEKPFRRLCKSIRWTRRYDPPTHIQTVRLNFTESLDELQQLYCETDYYISFQMESYVRNCWLIPDEVISLSEHIFPLVKELGTQKTVHILQLFASQLPIRTFENLSNPLNFSEILRDTVNQESWEPTSNPDSAFIHRLEITPTAHNMTGPEWIGTNRVLRLYPKHHDRFLKVSFVEEDLFTIQHRRGFSFDAILMDRWKVFFSRGIKLCGRTYTFLGFSQSSLKEHSAWFICPFQISPGESFITADTLRSRLGDFSHIHCAPRLAARIGQTFTTTSHSIDITNTEVITVDDVVRGGYTFSDGVGTISQAAIETVWAATSANEKPVKPVAYQIRVGGAKGVLCLDKTLKGNIIRLRRSMIKFETGYTDLEIANKAKMLPFFLNRQIIVILETLGVPPGNLMMLQEKEIQRLKIASADFDEASKLFERYALGTAARLPKILSTLKKEGMDLVFDMPFFRKLRELAVLHALKQIKYNARIPVERSWKLIGVMDEFGYLNEREIYVCLRDESGNDECLIGNTLVTRSPALHCGDIQIVRAVGPVSSSHPLSALYNCVVFSSAGTRPIPNQLSGGDLDGDLFDISQNVLLIPPRCESPANYDSVTPRESEDCSMDAVHKFFLDYILNDNLGLICTRHAIIADRSPSGVRDPDCIKLSELASIAVDFPKTGIPANIRGAPYTNTRMKPDFMARHPISQDDFITLSSQERSVSPSPIEGVRRDRTYFYESHKVLGTLYRAIDIDNLLRTWNENAVSSTKGAMHLWKVVEDRLKQLVPSYKTKWPEHVKEARWIFKAYMEEVKSIKRRFYPTPRTRQLSEAEVFLQCIRMASAAHRIRGRDRLDYLDQFRQAYASLVNWVRGRILGSGEERFQRAASYFYVGINSAEERKMGGESFAWITIPDLFEAWNKAQENGFYDGDHVSDVNS